MSFFAPLFLIGIVVAAAPVVIHLMRKRTAERVWWGAWMFLAQSLNAKRRRLLVEDIILLIVRTLIILLAVIAFARPFLPELHFFGGRGMDKDVVLVIDTSSSMTLYDGTDKSVFARAIEEASDLVERAPSGTSFGVVVGASPCVILTPSPLTSKRDILDLLGKLEPSAGTMIAADAIAAAGEVLAAGANPAKEIVVFGDGQAAGWNANDFSSWRRVERGFSRFTRRPPVVWRMLDHPMQVRNAAVSAFGPSRKVVGTDRPVTYNATIANSGTEAFAPGDAVLFIDGVESARLPVGQILPGFSRTFDFPCSFSSGGQHTVSLRLTEPDDLALDDCATNIINVLNSLEVLIVNGRPSEKGLRSPTAFLEAALRPELKGTNALYLVRPKVVRAAALEDGGAFASAAAVVMCDVPMLSPRALTNLTDYVKGGGGLLTVPGGKSEVDFYTNAVFAVHWKGRESEVKDVSFRGAPVTERVRFDESMLVGDVDVSERFSDGSAAIVSAPFGKGRSSVAAFAFELESSMLPARPSFVPFVHELVYSVAGTNSVVFSTPTAGRDHEGDVTALTDGEFDLLGDSIDLGCARTHEDVLSAVLGKSFGVEISRTVAVIVLLLLIAELLFCRKLDGERGGRERSRLEIALRVAAFIAILWMLSHVTWTHHVTRGIHRRVVVFTDASLSMQRADLDANGVSNSVPRYVTATNSAAMLSDALARRYDVESVDFGGVNTDFAAALESALSRISSEELAGAVFITDGRNTADGLPEAAARRFAHLGARVSSVLVGNTTNRSDAAIESLSVAEAVFLGEKVRPTAKVRADKLKGKNVTVRLYDGDDCVDTKEFTVDSDEWKKDVRFARDPGEKGVHRYRVSISTTGTDIENANDSWPFEVSVSDDRMNVFVADRRPRWEFRYLRNLLYGRDKSVHLQYLLTEPDRIAGVKSIMPPAADASRPYGEAEAGAFPETDDDWRKFDVIVIGDLDRLDLDDAVCKSIVKAVNERGAMLVVIAGEKHMPRDYAASPLAAILPVAFTNEYGAVSANWKPVRTPFALTPSGRMHPATALSGSASENDRIWASLPPAGGRMTGLTVKNGAEVLLCAGDSTALAAPLMTIRQSGRGKVVFFATDQTWLLRYRVGDTYHHRFWNGLLAWGGGMRLRDGNVNARVGTDMISYAPGAKVKVYVRMSDTELMPITGVKCDAEITDPMSRRHKVALREREGSAGIYEGVFDGTKASGEYQLTVLSPKAAAKLGDKWPVPLSTAFAVGESSAPREYSHLSADDEVPKMMANITGGHVVAPDAVKELYEEFGAGKGEIVERIEDPIWDHPFALLVMVAALITLWTLRKRRGLA